MILKSGDRFSEKIMLHQQSQSGMPIRRKSSRFGARNAQICGSAKQDGADKLPPHRRDAAEILSTAGASGLAARATSFALERAHCVLIFVKQAFLIVRE
jgi:hypothetical protein